MGKNQAAVALGKRRWAGKTKAERAAHMSMMGQVSAAKRRKKKPKKGVDNTTASA